MEWPRQKARVAVGDPAWLLSRWSVNDVMIRAVGDESIEDVVQSATEELARYGVQTEYALQDEGLDWQFWRFVGKQTRYGDAGWSWAYQVLALHLLSRGFTKVVRRDCGVSEFRNVKGLTTSIGPSVVGSRSYAEREGASEKTGDILGLQWTQQREDGKAVVGR